MAGNKRVSFEPYFVNGPKKTCDSLPTFCVLLKPVLGTMSRVVNPPFQALVIEYLQERGPRGLPTLSVAHYGEQNGDLMCDPEMVFEIETSGTDFAFKPTYWRNDYAGMEQFSVCLEGNRLCIDQKLVQQHEEFAALWNKNLEQQGFLSAFTRSLSSQVDFE